MRTSLPAGIGIFCFIILLVTANPVWAHTIQDITSSEANADVDAAKIVSDSLQQKITEEQAELEHLRLDQALQNERLQRQTTLRDLLVVMIVGTVIWAAIIFRAYIQLRVSNDKLQEANRQIAKQKDTLAEISDSQTELLKKYYAANATKDRFFSIIAHDLKNPLQIQLSGSRLLSQETESLTREEISDIAEQLKKNTSYLFEILDNLLQWSRMQLGALTAKPQSINLTERCRHWVNVYQHQAGQKSIDLSLDTTDRVEVCFDGFMMDSILNNLISNALKFSRPGDWVKLSLDNHNGMAVMKVADSGVGIEANRASSIFAIDKNISTRGTDNEKGTGLGLILCQEFCQLNSSSLNVKSAPGRGTTFTLTMPRAR